MAGNSTSVSVTAPPAPGGGGTASSGYLSDLSGWSWFSPQPGPTTTLPVPAAPQYAVGSAPQQQFTNNNFGNFNTPSMADLLNQPHNAVAAPIPPTPAPVAPVQPVNSQASGGTSLIQQIISHIKQTMGQGPHGLENEVAHNASFNPELSDSQLVSGALFANKPRLQAAFLKGTPNTALSTSGISIPATNTPAPMIGVGKFAGFGGMR